MKKLLYFVFFPIIFLAFACATQPTYDVFDLAEQGASSVKVSGMTELAEAPNDSDYLMVVDVSDTTMASTGTNKKVQFSYLRDAATGDSATGFFDTGTIEHEYGGLEADVSAYTGLVGITGGATSEVDTVAELESIISDMGAFFSDYADDADAATMLATLGIDSAANLETALSLGAYASDILGAADSDALVTLLGLVAGDIPDLSATYLALSGGTLTGEVTVDNLGLEFTEGDDHSDCSAYSATGGGIFYDDSEGKFKKCQDNVLTDLDATGSSGTMTTVEEGDVQVGGADIVTLDFGSGFDIAESPDTEINITLDLTEITSDALPVAAVYSGTTSLEETTGATDSGAYIIGVYDEFDNSNSTNIQDVLDDLDAAITGGGGDVTGVGDCASGACLDGTSDGGTYVRLYDGDSNYVQLDVGDLSGDITVNLPTSAGTLLLSNGDGSSLTSVDAATGDSATGFFDTGTIEHEYGGLEADISAYDGLIRITSGATSNVTDAAGLETALSLGAYASDILGAADSDALVTLLELAAGDIPDLSATYQPLDENLTQLSSGIDNRFNSADLKHTAPSTPEVGDRYVADGVVNNWNPGSLSTATITGSSDISFVEGGGSADTITDGGSGFVTAGFEVGMLIEVSSSTNNNGYYFLTAVAAGTLTLSNIDGGVTDGDLVDEANTSAQIDGGFPHKVAYDGSSWITENDNIGNSYVKSWQFDQTAELSTDDTYVGTIKVFTAGDNITARQWVYIATSDGKAELADNDATTLEVNRAIGIVVEDASEDASVKVLVRGWFRDDDFNYSSYGGSSDLIYLSSTAGADTQTRPTSASEAPQELGYAYTDDQIWVDPKPLDFSIVRVATDADGETLTCLECTNTIWEETGDTQDITLPAISGCPTGNMTLIANHASGTDLDVNAADDTIVDGVANADGEKMTSTSTVGDQVSCFVYDSDTWMCQSNGWTLE